MGSFKDNLKKVKTNKGIGIVTTVDVPKDTIIFEFKGDIFAEDKLDSKTDFNRYLQIGKNKLLGPSGDLDDYVNHSCAPCCSVKIVGHRAFLISLHMIKAGTEITFDYSTTSTDNKNSWSMNCNCGTFGCRKIISGYQHLDRITQQKYEALKIVPEYVKKTR